MNAGVLEWGGKIKCKKVMFCGGMIPFATFPIASWLLVINGLEVV